MAVRPLVDGAMEDGFRSLPRYGFGRLVFPAHFATLAEILRAGTTFTDQKGKRRASLGIEQVAALRGRWDALAIEQKRDLLDGLYVLEVMPGRDHGEKYILTPK